jgi:hypothetical protein
VVSVTDPYCRILVIDGCYIAVIIIIIIMYVQCHGWCLHILNVIVAYKKKLHCLSPRVNYTDRATAACRRSDSQLVRIEGAT